jgi:hypothetical protein
LLPWQFSPRLVGLSCDAFHLHSSLRREQCHKQLLHFTLPSIHDAPPNQPPTVVTHLAGVHVWANFSQFATTQPHMEDASVCTTLILPRPAPESSLHLLRVAHELKHPAAALALGHRYCHGVGLPSRKRRTRQSSSSSSSSSRPGALKVRELSRLGFTDAEDSDLGTEKRCQV